ncbi:MAG: MAPEG family protein [Marinobacter sp.]|nr:MAPEG family protein [Marinobacter sp.]
MIIPVTAIFASVLAVLMVFLAYRISMFRLKFKQSLGTTENPDFQAAVRAHGNLVEYAPMALVLMAIGEMNGVGSLVVYWVGMVFTLGRFLHAWGMIRGQGGPHRARLFGTLCTWLSMLAMAVLVVWNVLQVNG